MFHFVMEEEYNVLFFHNAANYAWNTIFFLKIQSLRGHLYKSNICHPFLF